MRYVPLFQYIPEKQLSWVSLIKEMTPVHNLKSFGKAIGDLQISVKREDLTDTIYGGNKVRNLEFLLGDVLAKKSHKIICLAPLGSNFIAALSAQAGKLQIPVEVHHFIPHRTDQMNQHAEYSKKLGAKLYPYSGGYFASMIQSSLNYSYELLSHRKNIYRMPTGGSNHLGALGHVNAFLELIEQVKKGEIVKPDFLIVGAGTCGTMAGLIAAQKLTQFPIKIIGVRCVDRVICNSWNIVRIANRCLKQFNINLKVDSNDVDLRDQGIVNYGAPTSDAKELIGLMLQSEGLLLDTTYTTKVISFLSQLLQQEEYKNKKFLYWHTFSSAAMNRSLGLELPKKDPIFIETPASL